MNFTNRLLITVLLGLFLSACGGNKGTTGTTSENTSTTLPTSNTGTTGNTGTVVDPNLSNAFNTGLSLQQLRGLGIEGDPLNYKTIYFNYNSSNIDQRSRVIVRAHARYLQSRSNLRVTLEGHADERGTRDYNLALGERRAKTVSALMKTIANNSINTISYGEERPIDSGHNDSAWSRNRRVQISY